MQRGQRVRAGENKGKKKKKKAETWACVGRSAKLGLLGRHGSRLGLAQMGIGPVVVGLLLGCVGPIK